MGPLILLSRAELMGEGGKGGKSSQNIDTLNEKSPKKYHIALNNNNLFGQKIFLASIKNLNSFLMPILCGSVIRKTQKVYDDRMTASKHIDLFLSPGIPPRLKKKSLLRVSSLTIRSQSIEESCLISVTRNRA